ncbi:MAG TPA: hypothetical protein VK486_12730 [Thermoleophilaceae bacterium]|nr:hypothetical protein [Thermoleophilaceae bacterium]
MKKLLIFTMIMAVLAVTATAAFAQSSTQGTYAGLAGADQGGGGTVAAATDNGGTLPFTGFQLGIAAALGVALASSGFALRRVTRNSDV